MDDFRLQIRGSQDDYAYNQGFGVLIFNNDFPEPEKPVAGSLNKSGGVDSQKLSAMSKFKLNRSSISSYLSSRSRKAGIRKTVYAIYRLQKSRASILCCKSILL
ncbi:uncharacterized protein LOC112502975 isoform X4 [Cynara cardunculus var. scolymus]|uniref:uncharacterized protein LOC112502975 isoform X4 n=1 Tax=Cynara cardunculus var. scolymus TaxID=59895 RepID=UPI000D62300B|nr:uncharacterized protein LOC112502975 isoform X4 [Cynara cardunculus var. scolymus]